MKNLFQTKAEKICGKNMVLTSYFHRLAYGTDAGFYRQIPNLVIFPQNETQVQDLLKLANETNTSLTFRAAGTSLSGQAISNSALVVLNGDNWNGAEVLNNGNSVKAQCAITGLKINTLLKKYKRKIGPDPASVNSATIGGIVANNASGMEAGITYNSYKTLKNIRLILADGTLLDTSEKESVENFQQKQKKLLDSLTEIRNKILSNEALTAKIQQKYSIKNTCGYGINSFIDFENPIDILTHLLIGSEGTLAFISEVELETVEVNDYKAGGLVFFHNIFDACSAAVALNNIGMNAIELIDREALRAIENMEAMPEFIKTFNSEVCALLVEFSAKKLNLLEEIENKVQKIISEIGSVYKADFTQNNSQLAKIWAVRKGIFPAVGANRKAGTTVVIEDVAFPLINLPQAISELKNLLKNFNYQDAVIYGHANDGNVHFIFSVDFSLPQNIENYRLFMEEIAKMVVMKYNGSLKAEHGTGRNMASFVAYEWGEELYAIMKDIKNIFDPKNILNPQVIINEDNNAYLQNFKPIPQAHRLIDNCIECGFCEINCLTNEFTVSSRQRIVLFREMQRFLNNNQFSEYNSLKKKYLQEAESSCAADGLCALTCPVKIDTGKFIKVFRESLHGAVSHKFANFIANNLNIVQQIVKTALSATNFSAKFLTSKGLTTLSHFIHKTTFQKIPFWHKHFPVAAKRISIPSISNNSTEQIVYFPSCISQSMGNAWVLRNEKNQSEIILTLLQRAGYSVIFPENMKNLCCGTPWESKGFHAIANKKSEELENALWKASQNGKLPILFDTSPCLLRMKNVTNLKLQLYEPTEFALKYLVPRLNIHKLHKTIAIHLTCSTRKMNLNDSVLQLSKLCAQNVVIPENTGCCGFAGDKGFTKPKINDWALRNLKSEVNNCISGYSNSKTCEIGLSRVSEINYNSIFYLLEEASREN